MSRYYLIDEDYHVYFVPDNLPEEKLNILKRDYQVIDTQENLVYTYNLETEQMEPKSMKELDSSFWGEGVDEPSTS